MTAQWPAGGPKIWAVGDMVDAALLNAQLRDPLELLEQHDHNGAVGDGSADLLGVVSITVTDAVAPSAPASGLTTLYATSARPGYIPNGGSATPISDLDHAARHNSGGADALTEDAAAGTPSLRDIGTGALDMAAGNHTH